MGETEGTPTAVVESNARTESKNMYKYETDWGTFYVPKYVVNGELEGAERVRFTVEAIR